jgi:hypothetical protein
MIHCDVPPESRNMVITRQRFGKHILEVTHSTVGPPLLGSKSTNTDSRCNGYAAKRQGVCDGLTHVSGATDINKDIPVATGE